MGRLLLRGWRGQVMTAGRQAAHLQLPSRAQQDQTDNGAPCGIPAWLGLALPCGIAFRAGRLEGDCEEEWRRGWGGRGQGSAGEGA